MTTLDRNPSLAPEESRESRLADLNPRTEAYPMAATHSFYERLRTQHSSWLKQYDPRHLRRWKSLLRNCEEAAMCEAAVRRFLAARVKVIRPFEKVDVGAGGPDFLCIAAAQTFLVETTCVQAETATTRTKLADSAHQMKPFRIWAMTEAVIAKCRRKQRQCSGLALPVLLAVGTFNSAAAISGFRRELVGSLLIDNGASHAGLSTNHRSARVRANSGIGAGCFPSASRSSPAATLTAFPMISGVMLLPLAIERDLHVGLVNPNADIAFNADALPTVDFGRCERDARSQRQRIRWQSAKK